MKASLKIGHIIGVFMDGWFSEVIGRKKVSLITLASLAGFIFIQVSIESSERLSFSYGITNVPIVLRKESPRLPRRPHDCWYPFGCLPSGSKHIRRGNMPGRAESLPHNLCVPLLGDGPVHLRWYHIPALWHRGSVGLADHHRGAVGLDSSFVRAVVLCSRLSLVGSPISLTSRLTFTNIVVRWLVRKGRYEDAKKAIRRLTDGSINVDAQVAMMKRTTELEVETRTGSSYWACFKGTNLRRTEIACVVWGIQAGKL